MAKEYVNDIARFNFSQWKILLKNFTARKNKTMQKWMYADP